MPISSTSSGHVLIVDDDSAVRLLIQKGLTAAGYTVLTAANTSSAERLLQTYAGQIRLVILDIMMPGVSGFDFANQLHEKGLAQEILYISGFGDSVAVEAIRRVNPEAILAKPFTLKELLARVERLAA